jgi:predicted  nucleic acid-binding Zn-ribbon protein
MGELIRALQRLQEIELGLARLRRREERKTRQIRTAEREIRRLDDGVSELRVECAQQQRDLEHLDRDVKSREAAILKHREELLRARTNKDYSLILTAINTEKADSAKIEKLALAKLGGLESVQEKVNARSQEQEAVRERLEAAKRSLEEFRDQTADERTSLQQERESAADAVPPSAMATFTRVAERHDGEALAEIIRLHPKREEYACGGCNMQVPLYSVNTVRLQDEIRLCPSCDRILCQGGSQSGES